MNSDIKIGFPKTDTCHNKNKKKPEIINKTKKPRSGNNNEHQGCQLVNGLPLLTL